MHDNCLTNMDLFNYTNLPKLCEDFDQAEASLTGITSNHTEADLLIWLNKHTRTMSKNVHRSYEAYTLLQKYLCGQKVVSDLVDVDNLKKMGMSPNLLQPFFALTTLSKSQKRSEDSLFFSLYLNAIGCARASDLIDCIMSFHSEDEKIQENSREQDFDKDLLQSSITKEDADVIANTIFNNHLCDPKTRACKTLNYQKTQENVAKIVCAKTLNMENLLGEIIRECIMPFESERFFVKETAPFSYVDYIVEETEMKLMSRPFNVKAHVNEMRNDFFNLALPQRFRLQDMDSAHALDVLLNTVLGCTLDLIKVISDVISFSCYLDHPNTDQILAQIKYNENVVKSMETDVPFNTMIKIEWIKLACFVVWFRIYTSTFGYDNLRISNVENFTTTKIQENVVYYYKGKYYLNHSKFNIVSHSYRCVLHHYGENYTNSIRKRSA